MNKTFLFREALLFSIFQRTLLYLLFNIYRTRQFFERSDLPAGCETINISQLIREFSQQSVYFLLKPQIVSVPSIFITLLLSKRNVIGVSYLVCHSCSQICIMYMNTFQFIILTFIKKDWQLRFHSRTRCSKDHLRLIRLSDSEMLLQLSLAGRAEHAASLDENEQWGKLERNC